jgi:23S rRNA pseudouridine1911/1915/1917 synthase
LESVKSRILLEDNHLLVVNKQAGELVQGDHTGDTPLLEKVREYIRVTYKKPGNVFTGLVHRLDRPTSGIVVFAKTGKALSRMNAIFEKRELNKIYWALVKQAPPKLNDRLVHYLKKDAKKNKSFSVKKDASGAKKAILQYKQLAQSDSFTLLEIELETGRHHQIRAQLAQIGSPIRGDLKYGFPRSNDDGSISLHARALSFSHPVTKEEINIVAPTLSDKVWRYMKVS